MSSMFILTILLSFQIPEVYARKYICGSSQYDSVSHICCNGIIYPNRDNKGLKVGCCSLRNETYVIDTQVCCGYQLLDRFNALNQERHCCNGQVHLTDEGECCEGKIYSPNGRMGCCGMKSFNRDSQFCCVHEDKSLVYQRTAPFQHLSCCHLKMIDTRQSYCDESAGEVLSRDQGRCGNILIDMRKQICCDGNIRDIPDVGRLENYTCCGPKLMDITLEQCCASKDHEVYTLISKTDKCCGKGSFNPHTHVCCNGAVLERPVTKGPTTCCGKRVVDLLNEQCCGHTVISKTVVCCGRQTLAEGNVCCRPIWGRDGQIPKGKIDDTDCCTYGQHHNRKSMPYNKYKQECDWIRGVRSKPPPTTPSPPSTVPAKKTEIKIISSGLEMPNDDVDNSFASVEGDTKTSQASKVSINIIDLFSLYFLYLVARLVIK